MAIETAHITQLAAFFEGRLGLKEKEELAQRFTARQVKRRGFVLHHGDVCRHFTFVVAGCFKMYATDSAGKEHNLEFAAESEWICDLAGFYAKQPSSVYIEAIEASTVLQIARPDLIELYAQYPKFNTGFRVISERKYIALQNRLLQTISATAEERYQLFLQQYPHLVSRLPNTQIASYLGITPEFLSKIRKDRTRA